ncbi:MAG: flavodoxin-dependent (E)-4-hydroxy-3-methylbut-2-enyl-diphosphate synthase [Dehalococcoidia bacterium]|nr:flavodoxin-dependent (E)-4-hydroxy-3-methylbut-2-enyl-diphosphate synthase [Dehalococcoidia bacterium]
MIKRRASRLIRIGGVDVGGGSPISVQSMTKTDTRDVAATVRQIRELQECGCEIVRLAVPDAAAARALTDIKKAVSMPVIADIHFDYRLALAALEAGVEGLRLNPGNISDPGKTALIVRAAREREVPIRIGVNAGSLPKATAPDKSVVERMVEATMAEVELLERLDFELIKISAKAFDVPSTVAAYREIAQRTSYPLHLGITEAGLPWEGCVRSAVGLGILLQEGIGDTIRVSLTTADPCEEVRCGFEILKSLKLREKGPILVSCPTCGRSESNIVELAGKVAERLQGIHRPIKVAVMGCVVNGPGEARDADVGIACGKGRGVIFRSGKQLRTVVETEFLEALMAEVEGFVAERPESGRAAGGMT